MLKGDGEVVKHVRGERLNKYLLPDIFMLTNPPQTATFRNHPLSFTIANSLKIMKHH
jgi:hypothetical protein